jgi:PAS domain S-box-containing protein
MDSFALDFYNRKIYEINIVFRSLKIKNLNLGKMIAFEVAKSAEGVAIYVSDNIQEEFGYSIEDFYLNLRVRDLIAESDFNRLLESFQHSIKNRQTDFYCEFKVIRKGGEPIWCYAYNHIGFSEDGSWKRLSGYILDITERKEREDKIERRSDKMSRINQSLEERVQIEIDKNIDVQHQLELAKRHSAMGETLEKIAHQWRQPLNIIALIMQDFFFKINLGEFDLNDDDSEDEEGYKRDNYKELSNDVYEKVNAQIQYISSTIDDFRKNLREDSKQEKSYFNVYELFEDVADLLNIPLTYEQIFLNIDRELQQFEIYGTKNNLKQVVLNLINNAKDIFRERKIFNRQIKIEFYVDSDSGFNVTICDNAGGIDDDIVGKIFDPYFTTRAETQGTGLGLYMSKEIMNRYFSGDLFVRNSKHGACFVLSTTKYRPIRMDIKES